MKTYIVAFLLSCLIFGVQANPDIRDFPPFGYNSQRNEWGGGGYCGAHFGIPGSKRIVRADGSVYQTYEERELRGGSCMCQRQGTSSYSVQCKNVHVEAYRQNALPGYDPDSYDNLMFTDRDYPCYYRPSSGGTWHLPVFHGRWNILKWYDDGSVDADAYLVCSWE